MSAARALVFPELNLHFPHVTVAVILELNQRPIDEIIGHALVHIPGDATPWVTYMVRQDGKCSQGNYHGSATEGRLDLLRRAGWSLPGGV